MKLYENNYETKSKNDQIKKMNELIFWSEAVWTTEQLRSFWLRWNQNQLLLWTRRDELRTAVSCFVCDVSIHICKKSFSFNRNLFLCLLKVWGLCLSLAAFRSCERTKRCMCFSSLWQQHVDSRCCMMDTEVCYLFLADIRGGGCGWWHHPHETEILWILLLEKVVVSRQWRVTTSDWSSVSVEAQTDSLQHPVWVVPGGGQVGLKHQPDTHGISAWGGGVHGGPQRVLWYKHTTVRTIILTVTCSALWRPEQSVVTPVTSGDELLWGRLWESAAQQL